MQAISFVARRGAGMAERGLFLESSEASSFFSFRQSGYFY